MRTKILLRTLAASLLLSLGLASIGAAARTDKVPTISDMSPSGLRAAARISAEPQQYLNLLPEEGVDVVRNFVSETRQLGLTKRTGVLFIPGPLNVQANNNAGDRVGETQSEISVAINADTVVIGWNDSQGFLGAPITLSSYAYSTNGGATFTDGGNVPLAAAGDQAFGDTGWDTDERGNWYLNQIYTRTGQQNIAVHHARFNGVGVLVLDPPVQAAIGTSATGLLDKCLLACDRVTGNVYVAYTRFTATPQIEVVRSTTLGALWDPPIVIDAGVAPTSSKTGARPFCGPGGEVYVVWEKGANSIFCPDGLGNVSSFGSAFIAFSRSLDFGLTYSAPSSISTLVTGFLASGPGDLRERANEFPDIGVDMTDGCLRGNIYVTWHTAADWTANVSAGPVVGEVVPTNNNPGTPDLFAIGNDATGAITPAGDLDYWQFSATQGQDLLIDVLPQGFVCGVSGTTRQMRVRLFATTPVYPNPTGFPDSLLAASFIGSFENRIVWTAPRTGTYLIRLQISGGTTTGTYIMRVRPLTFTPGAARDARDVVVSRSSNQGTSWTPPMRVNDDAAGLENRRPFIAVNSLGDITTYWHDSRDAGLSSTASLTSIYGTISRDGGLSWSPNFAVTDELSFFSFNTIAVPNLGDYNMAAGGRTSAVFHPAWSDQRISTGDVRTPGTNTYTGGSGPNAVTTGLTFLYGVSCPPNQSLAAGGPVNLSFQINNTGNVVDRYDYTITDDNGYITATGGTTANILAGGSTTIMVTATAPADCVPPTDLITLSVLPAGAAPACHTPVTCTTLITCEAAVATTMTLFRAIPTTEGVRIEWQFADPSQFGSVALLRATSARGPWTVLDLEFAQIGGTTVALDRTAVAGQTYYYRIDGTYRTGGSEVFGPLVTTAGEPITEFALRGIAPNPTDAGATIEYTVPRAAYVSLRLFDLQGREVASLANGLHGPGRYHVTWSGEVDGAPAAAGIYFLHMKAPGLDQTRRIVVSH
jgi:hypothetical protein